MIRIHFMYNSVEKTSFVATAKSDKEAIKNARSVIGNTNLMKNGWLLSNM